MNILFFNILFIVTYVISDLPTALGIDKHCCPGSGVYNVTSSDCLDVTTNSTTPNLLDCAGDYFSIYNESHNITFDLKESGSAYLTRGNRTPIQIEATFCITRTVTQETALVLCSITEEVSGVDKEVAEVLFFISGCFFSLTALVYAIIPELRDLQGKIITSLCGASSLGWIFMSLLHKMYSNMHLCAVSGFIAYFFLLASFFWMNALAIQVYRSVRHPNYDDSLELAFTYYSLYAWGCPGILLLSAILANYLPGDHYIPGFGYYNICWFSDITEMWLYFYGPMAVILTGNCVLFGSSVICLWRSPRSSQRSRALAYRVWMSARMFVVVGVMWTFELFSFLHGQQHVLWLIADIYNLLQGVLVFLLLVVMRRRVIKALANRGLLCDLLKRANAVLTSDDEEDEKIIDENENEREGTVVVPLNE